MGERTAASPAELRREIERLQAENRRLRSLLDAALFGGWEETRNGPVATPAKAIFDLCYVSAAHRGKSRRLPELDLPGPRSLEPFEPWLSRVESQRLRSITAAGLRYAIGRARAR